MKVKGTGRLKLIIQLMKGLHLNSRPQVNARDRSREQQLPYALSHPEPPYEGF